MTKKSSSLQFRCTLFKYGTVARIPSLKPREVERILFKLGFIFGRQKGSHRMYMKGNVCITVAFTSHAIKRGTLHGIIKTAGLSPEDFLKLR